MSNTLTASNGYVGPPLWLNHKWGFSYTVSSGGLTGSEIDVYLDKIGADPVDRVILTEASSGVSLTDTTLTVLQSPTWVSAELSAGTWEVRVLIDKAQVVWWRFTVLTPEAGAYTP